MNVLAICEKGKKSDKYLLQLRAALKHRYAVSGLGKSQCGR